MMETSSKIEENLLDPAFLSRLEQLQVVARKVFLGRMRGERRSRKKGVSMDFADYRDYVRGDDLRFLDWNIYSRLERLFIKLFQEEEDLYFYILFDASRSMDFGHPRKFYYARQLAAALGYIALCNHDKLVAGAFRGGLDADLFRPASGKGAVWRLLEYLNRVQCAGETNLQEAVRAFVLRHKRPGVAVIISDFMDPAGFEGALRLFVTRNWETFVIQVLSQEEVNPELTGHLELLDSELDLKTEVTINEALIRHYKRTLQAFCDRLRNYCVRYGIGYFGAQTSLPPEQLIFRYLRQIGLLK
ncbi:MAG: DUF58 domain-containing protein [Candidatus Sumerlaeia bacterium]